MPDLPPIIRPATDADRGAVTATLARAFSTGLIADWLFPDAAGRAFADRSYADVLWEKANAGGHIDVALQDPSGLKLGAAVWLSDASPVSDPALDEDAGDPRFAEAVGPGPLRRLAILHGVMAGMHPQGLHAQLTFVGVLPAHQNLGIASQLLRQHHERLDQAERASFLVATSHGAHRLYLRHGYRVTQTATLPDWHDAEDSNTRHAGVMLWAMVREPQATVPPAGDGSTGQARTHRPSMSSGV